MVKLIERLIASRAKIPFSFALNCISVARLLPLSRSIDRYQIPQSTLHPKSSVHEARSQQSRRDSRGNGAVVSKLDGISFRQAEKSTVISRVVAIVTIIGADIMLRSYSWRDFLAFSAGGVPCNWVTRTTACTMLRILLFGSSSTLSCPAVV